MLIRWRLILLIFFLCIALTVIIWRLVDLGAIHRSFLLRQSRARIFRTVKIPAHRGMITDRFGKPLAVSTPVDSIWLNPKLFNPSLNNLKSLSKLLKITREFIKKTLDKNKGTKFVYLKRHIPPEVANYISELDIKGVFHQREYRHYYPDGEVTAHVVGLTNVDNQGQEGLELGYNEWLQGHAGKKEVLKDRFGNTIADIALLQKPQDGHDLKLSIDSRIQYLSYHVLKQAVQHYQAVSGSIVVLDVKTGEILAMVNQPSYNPNDRPKKHDFRYRNRAVTDIFEPGSTIKPFNIAFALESGKYTPKTKIDTNPGWIWIGGYKIHDDGLNYGLINIRQVLQKSSNIGAAKIMLSLEPKLYWNLLSKMGFGHQTCSGFPGEVSGKLVFRKTWQPSVVATLAYGYGIAVTTLQLAHAFAILANDGVDVHVSFEKVSNPTSGHRVIRSDVAKSVRRMMESVVRQGGTGTRAQVQKYRVAGKTGTAYIATKNGYDKRRYTASFVGLAPASNPKLVVAVVVHEPKKKHFGGIVAAPVFSKVMGGALRILDVAPDSMNETS